MSFKNKVVLITGSGSGMGEATAILFAKEGADVVIVEYNEETALKTGGKCEKFGNRVLVIKTDVTKDDEAKHAIETTIKTFGKLDILVNNAGIVRRGKLMTGTIMDTFDEVMNTNFRAVVVMTNLAVPYLIKSKGCVVNTSSIASKRASKSSESLAYSMSKVGVDSFTRLAALELGPSGVRVNAVNPGPVLTNLLAGMDTVLTLDQFAKFTPLRKVSEPGEVAELIMFLASDKAKSITGGTYIIDNGLCFI